MKTYSFNSIAFKIRIFFVSFMVSMALVMNLFSACHPEEVNPKSKTIVVKTDSTRIAVRNPGKAIR
jgi:hypothetical protein